MPPKDTSESLAFLKVGEQISQGLHGGLHYLPNLYEAESVETEEPTEPWPKENPYFLGADLANGPDFTGAIETQFSNLLAVVSSTVYVVRRFGDLLNEMWDGYPNKRVFHLAKHAKKARVKKKNIKRLVDYTTKEARRRLDNDQKRATELHSN